MTTTSAKPFAFTPELLLSDGTTLYHRMKDTRREHFYQDFKQPDDTYITETEVYQQLRGSICYCQFDSILKRSGAARWEGVTGGWLYAVTSDSVERLTRVTYFSPVAVGKILTLVASFEAELNTFFKEKLPSS